MAQASVHGFSLRRNSRAQGLAEARAHLTESRKPRESRAEPGPPTMASPKQTPPDRKPAAAPY